MTTYTHFTVEGEHIFTEELFDYPHNICFLCELCGRDWARCEFAPSRKWRFITSHCAACDSWWGGSLFDLPDRALHAAFPRALLLREFSLETSRHGASL
jgi:hypothetical protein